MKDKKSDSLKKHIEKLTKPIFNRVLQETPINHTMVGKPSKSKKKTVTPSLYNPHNYRLYFNFTKEKYNPKKGMVGVWSGKFKNYDKEFTALGGGVRVTIKKTQAEVINKLSEQEWYFINRASAKEEIIALLNNIDKKCIKSLKKFIKVYGGKTDFVILKREGRPDLNLFTKSDNKIKNEPFIDKLPPEMTFETPIVSKRYKKPEVEFKEPIYAATYLENSALKEFAPEIAKEIGILGSEMGELKPVLKALTQQIVVHLQVQQDTLKTNKSIRMGISDIRDHITNKPPKKAKKPPIKPRLYGLTKEEEDILMK